jgi:hypothetical protein
MEISMALHLKTLLPASGDLRQQFTLFALVNLGLIDSLADGLLSATDAVRLFYNADNGLFVRNQLRAKIADEIMSRGAQLPNLFDVLGVSEAHREFCRELAAMRALCARMLEEKRKVA